MRTLLAFFLLAPAVSAMDRQWTRMTGQQPVETAPLITDWNGDGKPEALIINRLGQVLLWSVDGKALGGGQDGSAVQLPEGRWTSTPFAPAAKSGLRLLVGSVEGLVVALDSTFRVLWQQKLAGETAWAMGRPAEIVSGGRALYCFGDRKGVVSCFTGEGGVAWKADLGAPIRLAPVALTGKNGPALLVAAGSVLHCLEPGGGVRWKKDAGAVIVSGPIKTREGGAIAIGTEAGMIYAVAPDGREVWKTSIGETPDSGLAVMPGAGGASVLLCRGAWGNLHAIDGEGRRTWSYRFRTRSRNALVIGGRIVVPTFDQHVFALSASGELMDDYRVEGAVTGLAAAGDGSEDFLAVTNTLLAYRLRAGTPRSQYGNAREPGTVTAETSGGALVVGNPDGGLLVVNQKASERGGAVVRSGVITQRSLFELTAPGGASTGDVETVIATALGKVLVRKSWQPVAIAPAAVAAEKLAVCGDRAYSLPGSECLSALRLEHLYRGEADQGALRISSGLEKPIRARVSYEVPKRKAGTPFAGKITLREVVPTGSVNGESVPDALVEVGDAGLVSIPARGSISLWASVDARGAEAGDYTGKIRIEPLGRETAAAELPMALRVLPLKMPERPALKMCTWDYVPNRWFPDPKPALDDMQRHGVNVYPRTSAVPPGTVDRAGRMTIDWSPLDTELARLGGRGIILFQLTNGPLKFAVEPNAEARHRADVAYLRALRDHLRQNGLSYEDYAFYPVDEPGLDYGKVTLQILIDAGKLIREADPRFRIYTDPVATLSWKDFERIEPFIDVWCPNMRLVNGVLSGDPRMERILKSKHVWSYECISQAKSLSPLRYNRANAWRAKYTGLSGIGFWTHSTTDVDHWLAGNGINDEFALVYPGVRPVPSVRWEAARDGVEDIGAIALLEAAAERNRRAGTNAQLVEEAGREIRTALVDVMEMSDRVFIESRDYLAKGDRRLWHTAADVEVFERHRARIAALTMALEE